MLVLFWKKMNMIHMLKLMNLKVQKPMVKLI